VTSPLVRIEHVDRTFTLGDVSVRVLKGVDLTIDEARLLVIVGPSGSGKTTLLNLIGGLDQPSDGRVLFRDRDLSRLSTRQLAAYRRESVGFVFQFYNLIPNLTARENVQLAAEMADDPLDVDETLRLVGLGERLDHFPAQLSGGEQQRVALARALAKNPDLLLCDEPTGALDFETGKVVLGLLRNVRRDLGKTVVIITHNMAISQMADVTIRMRSGEIVERHDNDAPLDPDALVW
jgi:putative ABC transport system ATP-binding protein